MIEFRQTSAILFQRHMGIGRSENGWMCGSTFYEYIANVFLLWLNKQDIPKPIILFLDGHCSHMTIQVSDLCVENGIELLALYPNSTHFLQPMDVSVFRPLKISWRKVVRKFRIKRDGARLTLQDFAPLCEYSLSQISRETIANGFAHCGLVPFGFKNVKFFSQTNEKKNRAKIIDQPQLAAARRIVEERIDEPLLNIFRRFYVGEGHEEIDERHVLLYNLWYGMTEQLMRINRKQAYPQLIPFHLIQTRGRILPSSNHRISM